MAGWASAENKLRYFAFKLDNGLENFGIGDNFTDLIMIIFPKLFLQVGFVIFILCFILFSYLLVLLWIVQVRDFWARLLLFQAIFMWLGAASASTLRGTFRMAARSRTRSWLLRSRCRFQRFFYWDFFFSFFYLPFLSSEKSKIFILYGRYIYMAYLWDIYIYKSLLRW